MTELFSEDAFIDEGLSDPLFPEDEERVSNTPSFLSPAEILKPSIPKFREEMNAIQDESLDELDIQRDRQFQEHLSIAESQNPDQLARVKRLSDATGLPVEIVEQDPDQVERMTLNRDALYKVSQAPVLKKRITEDPIFAGASQGDIENLTFWETKFRNVVDLGPDPTFGERLESAGLSIMRGAIRAPQHVLSLVQLAGNFFGGEDFRQSTFSKELRNLDERRFQAAIDIINQKMVPDSVRRRIEGNRSLIPNFDQVLSTGLEQIPQLPGFFGVGAGAGNAARFFGASEKVASRVSGATTGLTFSTAEVYSETVKEARDVYKGLKQADGTPRFNDTEIENLAQRAAYYSTGLNALPSSVLGAIGLGPAFRAEGGFFKRALIGAASDFFPEGAQEVGEEIAALYGINLAADLEREVFGPENLPRLSQSFLLGASLGAVTGGGIGALSSFEQDSISAGKADLNEQVFLAMGENAQESKLAERLPELYQEFVEEATANGPVEDVYIDAKGFNQYFQQQGIDPHSFVSTIPGVANQLDDALSTGQGDIRIPLAEFAQKVARTEHLPGLLPHSKFDPNDFTKVEAETFRKEETQRLQEDAEKILREAETSETFNDSAQRVRQSVKQQIVDTGRFSADVADDYATLFEAKAIITAQQLEIQPHEVFEKFGLLIRSDATQNEKLATLDQQVHELQTESLNKFLGGTFTREDFIKKRALDEGFDDTPDTKKEEFGKEFDKLSDSGELDNTLLFQDEADEVQNSKKAIEDLKKAIKEVKEVPKINRSKTTNDVLASLENELAAEKSKLKELTKPQKKPSKKVKRGSFQFPQDITTSPSIITLLEDADLSTFLHETAHFFFEIDRHIASQKDAPQEVVESMNTLVNFVGVQSLDAWNALTHEQRRDGHEKVARAFEAYLFEGKAPSVEMRSLFRRFAAWLKQVYRNLTGLKVTLTDEVRGVFDRMLATDDQLAVIRNERSYQPIFESAEEAGMTEVQWKAYREAVITDEDAANEELQTRSLKNMKWLSRAKGIELRRIQRETRKARQQMEEQVKADVLSQPEYAVRNFLRGPVEKKEKVKSFPNVLNNQVDSLFAAIGKLGGLNKAELVNQWGLDRKEKINSGVFGKPLLRAESKGLELDRMADALALEGYIALDDQGRADMADFESRFFDELSGNKRFSRFNENFNITEEWEAHYLEDANQIDLSTTPNGKLSIPALIEIYGNADDAIWKQLPTGRFGMVAEDGLHPNAVAELFGFGSGDEMINKIVNAQPMKDVVIAETDSRMQETFGELNTPQGMEQAANEAVHNTARTKMVHAEMKALAKKTGRPDVLRSAAKDFAESRIGNIQVRNIKPSQYIAAENRASRLAERALVRGNIEEAADHKRAQILNHHFAKTAVKARGDIDKAVDFLNKFNRAGTRKSIDPEYMDQIDSLLESYDLRKAATLKEIDGRKSFIEFVEAQREQGLEPIWDEQVIANAQKKSFKDMTLEEVMGLRDTVKSIEHVGRVTKNLFLAKKKQDLETAAENIVASINKNSKKKKSKKLLEPRLAKNQKSRLAKFSLASHRKFANLVRVMDGLEDGGVVWEHLIRPLNEQTDWETDQVAKATERLGEIFNVYTGKEKSSMEKEIFIPELQESMSKMGRLVVAFNWGNQTNRSRMMQGNGWSDVQVQAILDTLDKRDFDFVQSVWNFVDEFWEDIAAKQTRVTGIAPKKVNPAPFETRHGTYRGGYYPIAFEPLLDQKAFADEAAEAAKAITQGNYARATTRRNHTKERLDTLQVKRPVRLDFSVLFGHVDKVIHDLAFHEYLIDANRLLKHPDVQDAIISHYGIPVYDAIRETLTDVAVGPIAAKEGIEKAISWVRQGTTISMLGWNLGTAVLQPFGLSVSMARIGPKWVAKGIYRWLRGAASMEGTVEWITEVSPFMRDRGRTLNREINEIRNTLGDSARYRRILGPAQDSYFELIRMAQMLADVPTWLGQYEKSMASGETEGRAIAIADQAVIDSRGSGHIKDLSSLQRGGQFQRLWFNFYSYFNVMWNLLADRVSQTQPIKHPLSVGRLAVDVFAIITFPVLLETVVRDALLKGACDNGRDIDCLTEKMILGQLAYSSGMLFGLRELSGAIQGFTGYSGPTGTRIFAETIGLGKQVAQGEVDEGLLKKLNSVGGILFHYPSGQLQKTVDGFMAHQTNKTDNPAAPLFGVSKR